MKKLIKLAGAVLLMAVTSCSTQETVEGFGPPNPYKSGHIDEGSMEKVKDGWKVATQKDTLFEQDLREGRRRKQEGQ